MEKRDTPTDTPRFMTPDPDLPINERGRTSTRQSTCGVVAHTKLRESYHCPACHDHPARDCDYCDTGRVTLRRAEIIRKQLQSQKSPKIG